MLIRFSFKNFKSIGAEPLTLEMVSSTKVRTHKHHVCVSSESAKVLRNAVIYGGNAAGKSSIVVAFSFMKAAVLGGTLPQGAASEYCKCEKGMQDEETTFDIQLQVDGRAYDYGFSCILSKMVITSEWLYSLNGKTKLLFQRCGSESVDFSGLEGRSSKEDKIRFDVYVQDFLHQPQTGIGAELFLSAMSNGRAYSDGSSLNALHEVFSWFGGCLDVIGVGQRTASSEFYADNATLDKVSILLSSFDTGIKDLKKQELTQEELAKYIAPEVLNSVLTFIKDNRPQGVEGKVFVTFRNDNVFLGIEGDVSGELRATVLKIEHEGSIFDFEFREESDGTRRLFDFMDILFTRSKDKVFVVDELNRSFHPMLTKQLVELFNEVHADDDCQLVFTTHEDAIMSLDYFRRDEIWFVERTQNGSSVLYPLDKFNVRPDARLDKQYLEGRYGGVPVLSSSRALAALGKEGR